MAKPFKKQSAVVKLGCSTGNLNGSSKFSSSETKLNVFSLLYTLAHLQYLALGLCTCNENKLRFWLTSTLVLGFILTRLKVWPQHSFTLKGSLFTLCSRKKSRDCFSPKKPSYKKFWPFSAGELVWQPCNKNLQLFGLLASDYDVDRRIFEHGKLNYTWVVLSRHTEWT